MGDSWDTLYEPTPECKNALIHWLIHKYRILSISCFRDSGLFKAYTSQLTGIFFITYLIV